ncbi:hypothetical protein N7520_002202 [Penicillium odoratum]|uniref:uncharacterized protein n=1 Tax=Penicillium odoratum TaxID=1167516 RepID=UPI002546A81B|nr:uncharacterized protein N7520_002202 [Penicillium odoratum]KAJ5771673.1 hypothetical protein N7520_002202 [Penicillium odoratum]
MSSATGTDSATRGLKVLIVGAGIGGLAAAIGLRQEGHELYERSQFANEVGAAIHLTPNANGALKRIGIDVAHYGAVEAEQIRNFTAEGKLNFTEHVSETCNIWKHKWVLMHRAHLHRVLKEKARGSGKGKPVALHTSSKVSHVDPHTATVTLADGRTLHGDVVLGADGVHSVTRRHVSGDEVQTFTTGKNAFRFMVPKAEFLEDMELADLVRENGVVGVWHNDNTKVVIYPCVNNEVLNFVCIHPDTLTHEISHSRDQSIGKTALLDIYKNYDHRVHKMLKKADSETLSIWSLLDMPSLSTWVNDRLAVMGDAAHPFLPFAASGGAMAIEDGLSLAVMLTGDMKREEVPARLKLYEKARRDRAMKIQAFARESGKKPLPEEEVLSMRSYIFGHDEWEYSSQLLREHRQSSTPHL